jgi:hypothetical protein
MIMDLDIICIIECDDCGKSVIIDPTYVTLLVSDSITAAALCSHCERPVVEDIDRELAKNMMIKGVKALSWISGEPVEIDDI